MALHESLEDQPPYKRSRPPTTILDPFEDAFGGGGGVQPVSSINLLNVGGSTASFNSSSVIEPSRESSRHSFEQSRDCNRDNFGINHSQMFNDELASPMSLPLTSPQGHFADSNSRPSTARPPSLSNRSTSSSISGLLSPFDRCLGPVSEESMSPLCQNSNKLLHRSDPNDDLNFEAVNNHPAYHLRYNPGHFNSSLNEFDVLKSSHNSPNVTQLSKLVAQTEQIQQSLLKPTVNGCVPISSATQNVHGRVRASKTSAATSQGGTTKTKTTTKNPRGRPPSSSGNQKSRNARTSSNNTARAIAQSPLVQPPPSVQQVNGNDCIPNGMFESHMDYSSFDAHHQRQQQYNIQQTPMQTFSTQQTPGSAISSQVGCASYDQNIARSTMQMNLSGISSNSVQTNSKMNGVSLMQSPGIASQNINFPHQSNMQRSPMNISTSNLSPSTIPNGPLTSSMIDEAARIRLLTAQMVLLLHAYQCSQRDKLIAQFTAAGKGLPDFLISPCQVQQCTVMKCILNHVLTCHRGEGCEVQHCTSSRKLIRHWRSCIQSDCPICSPIRIAANQYCTLNPAPLTTSRSCKAWQKCITPDVRSNLLSKLVNSLFSINDDKHLKDKRMPMLINYVRKLEADVFDSSIDQDSYFMNLAEKAFTIIRDSGHIRKDLNEQIYHNDAFLNNNQSLRLTDNDCTNSQTVQIANVKEEKIDLQHVSAISDIQDSSLNVSSISNSFRMPYNPDAMAGEKGPPNKIAPSALLSPYKNRSECFDQSKPKSPQAPYFANDVAFLSDSSDMPISDISRKEDMSVYENNISSCYGEGLKRHHHPSDSEDQENHSKISNPSLMNLNNELSDKMDVDSHSVSSTKKERLDDTEAQSTLSCNHLNDNNESSNNPDVSSDAFKEKVSSNGISPELRIEFKDKINFQVLHEIFMSDDSIPFRQPVDPVLLNIPDYFEIIKHPMDLSTIKRKLDELEYDTPWDLIDDMWLMFQNAWTYNKKTSKIFKMCSRLSELFVQLMNTVMVELGYCCGEKHVFLPQVMFCFGNQLCSQIARDATYYCYTNKIQGRTNLTNDKYTFCSKCFESYKEEFVPVGDDPGSQMHNIAKSDFETLRNDHHEYETFIDCKICKRKWHCVCGLFHVSICTDGFICPRCEAENTVKCKRTKLTASKLSNNKLGNWIENRVNGFLSKSDVPSMVGKIHIRVLASFDKTCETKPRIKKYYAGKISDKFPFRSKAIFAFQEIDGQDVAFFGLHVQEYDSNAPWPNSKRVYISYLDSVYFFQPRHLRTDIYHEILIGYLDWAKRMGYQWGHIWACPPSEGDDYIFYCHPPDQKVPKQKRLIDWYRKMLDKALLDRVVIGYQDIMKDVLDNDIKTLNEIPYFDGDFWPNVFEESIKEIEQDDEKKTKDDGSITTTAETCMSVETANNEDLLSNLSSADSIKTKDSSGYSGSNDLLSLQQSQRNISESATDEDEVLSLSGCGSSKRCSQKKKKHMSKNGPQRKQAARKLPAGCCDLTSKVFTMMEKHKEVFFVIRLSDQMTTSPNESDIIDLDPILTSELMDGRDAFLNFCRERHLEFSSLRRAKYSTMLFLYEIHNQGADRFVYTCNKCKAQVEVRFHCTVCEDFDLCVMCYQNTSHEHPMEKLSTGAPLDIVRTDKVCKSEKFGESGDISVSSGTSASTHLQYSRQQSIEQCIEIMLHAVNCRNANCSSYPGCQKMKLVVQHIKQCSKTSAVCQICRQINMLCHPHARICTDPNCAFPFCAGLKQKIQKQKAANSQLERRRMMTTMQRNVHQTTTPSLNQTNPSSVLSDTSPALYGPTAWISNMHLKQHGPKIRLIAKKSS